MPSSNGPNERSHKHSDEPASKVPQPLPETLWGERWQFVRLRADDLEARLLTSPIPIREVSPLALPSQQQLSSDRLIPGVVVEAGRQSRQLARWTAAQQPLKLEAVNRELGALMLDSLTQRWIIATYQDAAVTEAAQSFEALKRETAGIHFLLIQPDDTGITYSGLWIFRAAP